MPQQAFVGIQITEQTACLNEPGSVEAYVIPWAPDDNFQHHIYIFSFLWILSQKNYGANFV